MHLGHVNCRIVVCSHFWHTLRNDLSTLNPQPSTLNRLVQDHSVGGRDSGGGTWKAPSNGTGAYPLLAASLPPSLSHSLVSISLTHTHVLSLSLFHTHTLTQTLSLSHAHTGSQCRQT